MVMRILNDEKTPAVSGPATEEGRRSKIVGGPETASPELLVLPRRRSFKARDKLRILAEVDGARETPGGVGAVLRREGLYSSALSDWRRQREAGALAALSPVARGPKTAPLNPLAADYGVCQSSCPLNLFHAASRSCPAMGAPPPASWWSASAPPRPCRSSLGRSGLSQTDPTGSQFRVLPDHRAGCLARAA